MTYIELLPLIFRAPISEDGWGSALEALKVFFKADLAILTLRSSPGRNDSGLTHTSNGFPDAALEWLPAITQIDGTFLKESAQQLPRTSVFRCDLTNEEQSASSFRAWGKRHGFNQTISGLLWENGPHVGFLSLMRRDELSFSDSEEVQLSNLLPHWASAIELQRTLDQNKLERDSAYAVLDSLSLGVLLTLEDGTVVHSNGPAQDLLAEGDAIRISENRLVLPDGAEPELKEYVEKQLARAARMDSILSGAMSVKFKLPRTNGAPIWMSLGPLKRSAHDAQSMAPEPHKPTAAVFLLDPSLLPELSSKGLEMAYGLTTAESHLAVSLADGDSLQEAAAKAGRSEATFRKHLQSIFAKTETHRQSELVALILRRIT